MCNWLFLLNKNDKIKNNMKWCWTHVMIESIIECLKEYRLIICELNAMEFNKDKIKFDEKESCNY